jgi:site-specific DNA-methyltransferase (adenine-specific)
MNKIEIDNFTFYNADNLNIMKLYPDKYFELALVDPPYGINHAEIAGKQSGSKYGNAAAPKKVYKSKDWDSSIPDKSYFDELFRISKNQIIWGANYFTEYLPNSMGWMAWNKNNGTTKFSDCELAFTSYDKALRMFTYTWNGMLQQNMKNKEDRIHPTQKPIDLYSWILQNYAKQNDKILDTHLGSASIALAIIKATFIFRLLYTDINIKCSP